MEQTVGVGMGQCMFWGYQTYTALTTGNQTSAVGYGLTTVGMVVLTGVAIVLMIRENRAFARKVKALQSSL